MINDLSKYKEKYLLYSKFPQFKRKVEKAKEYISEALSKSEKPTLSFSGGKDSVVMLDLAVKCGFKGGLMFFKYGIIDDVETPKENVEILKYYADKYSLEHNIIDCLGEVDCWEECGKFIFLPETDREKAIFRKTNFDFVKKSKEFEKENGIDLDIIGMRKDESKNRKFTLNKKGAIYQTNSRQSVTCCPLLNFSDDDIWAYIFSNNLKYLSVYDYPYIDRCKIRNEITMLYNYAIIRNGIIYHYKKMYPDFFAYLKERWGEFELAL